MSLETMKERINYNGGKEQESRMNVDKLRTLKKALLYSYQAATARLTDGREFRCLINPDKLKTSYDEKIISIPFFDIQLNPELKESKKFQKTSKGEEEIGMKPGDVFTWKETNTDWLVYLRRYEETAYFRAEIRKCDYEIEVNDKKYKVYIGGPDASAIIWNKVKKTEWNDLNYSITMYVTKDKNTEAFFHRFAKIDINEKPWEVQAIDSISQDGIIIIALKETYENSIEEAVEKEKVDVYIDLTQPYIKGPETVYPYDVVTYYIKNAEGGEFVAEGSGFEIASQDAEYIKLGIVTGKSGSFTLKYKIQDKEDIVLPITIGSL
jgi:hypothetical protein